MDGQGLKLTWRVEDRKFTPNHFHGNKKVGDKALVGLAIHGNGPEFRISSGSLHLRVCNGVQVPASWKILCTCALVLCRSSVAHTKPSKSPEDYRTQPPLAPMREGLWCGGC
jgi:hypothetical protein